MLWYPISLFMICPSAGVHEFNFKTWSFNQMDYLRHTQTFKREKPFIEEVCTIKNVTVVVHRTDNKKTDSRLKFKE